MKGLFLFSLACAEDPALLRQEMQQERKLLNAKIAEADAAKAKATGLETQLEQTRQALLSMQARDAGLSATLATEQQRDGNLTKMLADARLAQQQHVAQLEQQLQQANATAQQEAQYLQSQVAKQQQLEAQERDANAARIQKIRDVLRDALAVPVAVPSPFRNATAKLTLARLANATLSVEDTVDDSLEHTAATINHQDRVLNWAFRKLDSEGKQLKAMNISKAASEKKADVLETELAASVAQEKATEKSLADTTSALEQAQALDASDRTAAESRLEDAQTRLQEVHNLVAKAAQD